MYFCASQKPAGLFCGSRQAVPKSSQALAGPSCLVLPAVDIAYKGWSLTEWPGMHSECTLGLACSAVRGSWEESSGGMRLKLVVSNHAKGYHDQTPLGRVIAGNRPMIWSGLGGKSMGNWLLSRDRHWRGRNAPQPGRCQIHAHTTPNGCITCIIGKVHVQVLVWDSECFNPCQDAGKMPPQMLCLLVTGFPMDLNS